LKIGVFRSGLLQTQLKSSNLNTLRKKNITITKPRLSPFYAVFKETTEKKEDLNKRERKRETEDKFEYSSFRQSDLKSSGFKRAEMNEKCRN